jgi:hypothetical protein
VTETAIASTTKTVPPEPPIAVNDEKGDRRGVYRRRLAFLLLALALAWIAIVRVPLIINARHHLDSDLAVDGIVLREAARGQWRWHYPATPHIGIPPVLFSLPQALVWGANPATLVSGGTVAYAGLVLAIFTLSWTVFGRAVALWGLVPLTFASTGTIWLSGRITGGHLTAVIWHALAFLLLYRTLVRRRRRDAIALGLWCGLGFYVDSMFVLTLTGLVPAAFGSWWRAGRSKYGMLAVLLFGVVSASGSPPERSAPESTHTTPMRRRPSPHSSPRSSWATFDCSAWTVCLG